MPRQLGKRLVRDGFQVHFDTVEHRLQVLQGNAVALDRMVQRGVRRMDIVPVQGTLESATPRRELRAFDHRRRLLIADVIGHTQQGVQGTHRQPLRARQQAKGGIEVAGLEKADTAGTSHVAEEIELLTGLLTGKEVRTLLVELLEIEEAALTLTWDSLAWLRSITSLPILVKGILTAEDAELAVQHGVDAIIVSNHGGRQLDTALASIEALPEIVDAVSGRCEVYMDGGIRRGTDVLKALALGARAVLVGRPILWGLAANGAEGVHHVLEILRRELELSMALAGHPTLNSIDRSLVKIV